MAPDLLALYLHLARVDQALQRAHDASGVGPLKVYQPGLHDRRSSGHCGPGGSEWYERDHGILTIRILASGRADV